MRSTEKYNRIRPLKIYEILKRETYEEHPMGTEELREKLLEFGIDSHRTTIYADIEERGLSSFSFIKWLTYTILCIFLSKKCR